MKPWMQNYLTQFVFTMKTFIVKVVSNTFFCILLELHSITQTLTTRMHIIFLHFAYVTILIRQNDYRT
jgi:hypothetical protein